MDAMDLGCPRRAGSEWHTIVVVNNNNSWCLATRPGFQNRIRTICREQTFGTLLLYPQPYKTASLVLYPKATYVNIYSGAGRLLELQWFVDCKEDVETINLLLNIYVNAQIK